MAKKTPQARYTKPGDDGMTGLERSFAQHLEARRAAGEIWRWELHAIKLRVVAPVGKTPEAEGIKGSYYTPDFLVFENDGTIAIYETKGYHDPAGDAWIKYKDAVSRYPFAFYFVRKVAKAKGTWDITRHR